MPLTMISLARFAPGTTKLRVSAPTSSRKRGSSALPRYCSKVSPRDPRLAGDGVELDHGLLVGAAIAEGVDRPVVEVDGLDPHQLLGHGVGVDLADRRGDDVADHHRGLGLGRHHDHAVGGGLGQGLSVGLDRVVLQIGRQGRRRLFAQPVDEHLAAGLLAAGLQAFQGELAVDDLDRLAVDVDPTNFRGDGHGIAAPPLIGGGRRNRDAPERLQPAFAVDDREVVFLGVVEQARDPRQGAERLQPLGPGAALGVLQAEPIGQPEDALLGEFDLHAGPPCGVAGIESLAQQVCKGVKSPARLGKTLVRG